MTPHRFPFSGGRRAFTLIEMIGVLAVMAILAAVLIPALIKETDKAVADQEIATLQSFSTALQNNILRTRRIPADDPGPDWATNIAAEIGLNLASVTNNVRRQPRIFLIDTQGFGALALPYPQTQAGTNLPPNPRFMIISSLGAALPAISSRPATSYFSNLWNSGTVPGFNGDPNDVIVQRISLGSLFTHLVLNNSDINNAPYSIDGITTNYLSPTNQFLDTYYLTGTVFKLYLANANLEASQVLLQDSSWWFAGGIWRNSSVPAGSIGGMQPIVQKFYTNSSPNSYSTTTIYTVMVNYMSDFINSSSLTNTDLISINNDISNIITLP